MIKTYPRPVNERSRGGPGVKPKAALGFEHVNRYWDHAHQSYAAKILPGEYYVTLQGELITTVLGSCVSACIRDRKLGVGGMNHFMLPDTSREDDTWRTSSAANATRYGSFAMERLINDILKYGGRRERLEAKIFGGGRILAQMTDIGRRNIAFVKDYLAVEGVPVLAEDVGSTTPRKVVYFPSTGRVRVKAIKALHNDTILRRETNYMLELEGRPIQGDVELF